MSEIPKKIMNYKDVVIECVLNESKDVLKIHSVIQEMPVYFNVKVDAQETFDCLSENDGEQLHEYLYDIYLAKLG